MQSNSTDNTPTKKTTIVVEDYTRMETGGWIVVGLGIIGAVVLLTVGVTTDVTAPTGTAALTVGLYLSGCILLVGRLVLRKQDRTRVELEDHKADHQVAQIDTEDLAAIRNDIARILVFMARREHEDRVVEELVRSVEGWLKWKAGAEERLAEHGRQLAALTDDGVVDLDTVRELKQLAERRRDRDA